jgi:hypothetical protein
LAAFTHYNAAAVALATLWIRKEPIDDRLARKLLRRPAEPVDGICGRVSHWHYSAGTGLLVIVKQQVVGSAESGECCQTAIFHGSRQHHGIVARPNPLEAKTIQVSGGSVHGITN